jgi:hypothetical protein
MARVGWVATLALSVSLAGCGEGNAPSQPAPDATNTEDWLDVVSEIEEQGQVDMAYSMLFYGEPPGNYAILTNALIPAKSSACSEYSEHLASPEDGDPALWRLTLELSSPQPGEYQVVPGIDYPASTPMVGAYLEHWESGSEIERHTALGGTVTIVDAAQDAADWNSGKLLSGSARLEFPLRDLKRNGCVGIGNVNDPADLSVVCNCADENGPFTCVPDEIDQDCCYDFESERRTVEFTIGSEQCAAMCNATSLLFYQYCNELQ